MKSVKILFMSFLIGEFGTLLIFYINEMDMQLVCL